MQLEWLYCIQLARSKNHKSNIKSDVKCTSSIVKSSPFIITLSMYVCSRLQKHPCNVDISLQWCQLHIECKTLCAPLQLSQDEWFQSSSKTKDNQIGSSNTKEQQKPVTTLWANTTSYPLLKLSSTSIKQPSQNWKLFALLNWLTFTLMMAIFRESGGDGHQWMYLKCSVATLVACFCLSTCF